MRLRHWRHRSSPQRGISVRYYLPEHQANYRELRERGLHQWNDLFDSDETWTYDHFQNRSFLERVLPTLKLPTPTETRAFEYGCGTGPAACYLARRGYQVDAVDLIPDAIAIAREMAEQRGVNVNWDVADICAVPMDRVGERYDLVIDSFCLQSIVTDEDRTRVFSAVKSRLKPRGYYLISTAMRIPGREYGPDDFFDRETGILYEEVPAGFDADGLTQVDNRWLIPNRRHLGKNELRDELRAAGFDVLSFEVTDHADIVCRL